MSTEYIPILKWKQGEQQALGNLRAEQKVPVTPMVEVLQESVDDGSYAKVVKAIAKCWGNEKPVLLELGAVEQPQLELAHQLIREAGASAIPVTGIYRDAPLLQAAAAVIKADALGGCIRVTPDEVAEATFAADLMKALSGLRLQPEQVDIVFDSGYLLPSAQMTSTSMAFTAVGFLNALPELNRWRSVCYAASSFPENLAAVGVGTATLPRAEWEVWRQLVGRMRRPIRFGDYAVAHPYYQPTPLHDRR